MIPLEFKAMCAKTMCLETSLNDFNFLEKKHNSVINSNFIKMHFFIYNLHKL